MSSLDLFSLEGKVAVVTGGGTGLGRGMALALAGAGADIALVGLKTGLADAAAEIRALGRRALEVEADLSNVELADGIMQQVLSELGGLDILINCAGTIRRAPALEVTPADWDFVININQRAVFFLSQAAGKIMAARGGGKIINIASMLSFQGGILVPSYTASKHAVAGITKALANEWASKQICVNAIAPGYMATDNTAPLRADPVRSASILERIPAGRWGAPDDLQGAAIFLASAASNYVNGHVLCVDGGWMVR